MEERERRAVARGREGRARRAASILLQILVEFDLEDEREVSERASLAGERRTWPRNEWLLVAIRLSNSISPDF